MFGFNTEFTLFLFFLLLFLSIFIFLTLLFLIINKASKTTAEIISRKKTISSKSEIRGSKIAQFFFVLGLIIAFLIDITTNWTNIHGDALGGLAGIMILSAILGFIISGFLVSALESKKIWYLILGYLFSVGLILLFGKKPFITLSFGAPLILIFTLKSGLVLLMLSLIHI